MIRLSISGFRGEGMRRNREDLKESLWHMRVVAICFVAALPVLGGIALVQSASSLKEVVVSLNRETLSEAGTEAETILIQNFPLRNAFVDLNGLEQNLLNRNIVEDAGMTLVKDSKGYLHSLQERVEVKEQAVNVAAMHRWLGESDIPFLYVAAPYKADTNKEYLPVGTEDGTRENKTEFLEYLRSFHVPFLDISSSEEAAIEFYRTDHHWTIGSAWRAVRESIRSLDRAGFELIYDKRIAQSDSYVYRAETGGFLGSQGRRVGRLYAGQDDFTYVIPDFDTDMYFAHLVEGGTVYEASGSFGEALISPPLDTGYAPDYYSTYMNNSWRQMIVKNHASMNDKKVLVISDSFGRPFGAFLSLYFGETVVVDIQKGRFEEDLYQFIEGYDPDVVIMLFNGGMLNDKGLYQFDKRMSFSDLKPCHGIT